ncbi:hypothetical protein MOC16_gp272 [Klebsiella phage vB_KpM_FBKp24]|uniref:Uncharacterized protein n=1 Tax=Klebsiella phage vB_KpM_FBKp24 TaxID=2801834 RepID=A0A7U0GBP8_9CAUD|nr:hypothetical protein [Klebsiella pneumoniae]YP_010298778.1 hypothetical protein MOC16_gp272 [Klebsiella phage vB_KpM_FBKp24]QQV92184.1 hypothetical protein vBKpMFBKp24_141 [Klebsiella phage vB_KpM_FBKp24]
MKSIKIAVSVIALALTSSAFAANELVWDAEYNQTQISCGIDYANGVQVGGILLKGETGTNNSKAINFVLTSNTAQKNWRLTEAKLTQNTGRFDFADNLMTVSNRDQTSVFVNNVEYAWTDAAQAQNIAGNTKTLALAPKINLDAQQMPFGVTHIQGKLVLTCN